MITHVMLALALLAPAGAPAAHDEPRRPVYVTNILTNDISTFAIRPDGGLKLRPERVPTGESPRGIVVSPNGRFAYAANGESNTISAYKVGGGGGLTPLPPPARADDDPQDGAFSPDGRMLYVVNRAPATVSAFSVGDNGALTALGAPEPVNGEDPRGIAVTPDGRFLFVSTGSPLDPEPAWLVRYAIRGNGTLAPFTERTPIGAAGGPMAISPDGRFLYVACGPIQRVFGFAIDPRDGAPKPVPGSPFFAPEHPLAAAITPDGRHLYVTAGGLIGSGNRKVAGFNVRGDGSLTSAGNVDAGDTPVGITPTPDGRHLYVGNADSNDVSAFRIRADGRLRELPGPRVKTGGERPALQSVTILPNQGPVASFDVRPGRTSRFDASASADPDGRVARYDWDFGDGTVRRDAGPTPSHTYRRAGVFTVTLTVTDDEGCSAVQVFTGRSALCNGSTRALARQRVVV